MQLEKSAEITPERMKTLGQSRNDAQFWMGLVVKIKSDTVSTSQSNHTRATALSNSMKPSHAWGATQDGWVMVERSDRVWSTGEGNGKPLQYSCLENPMNSMKRQNEDTKRGTPQAIRCPICYWRRVEK